jgi:hypothetical protein
MKVVPIRVTGTREAMPPGRLWPKRLRAVPVSKRHRITVSFGEPITPTGDAAELIESVQKFFNDSDGTGSPYKSPYSRLGSRNGGD